MENKMMHFFKLLLLLACITAAGTLYALTAQDGKDATTTQDTATQKRPPPAKPRPQKTKKPATTFKPSERIGADSAVSFPVDI